MGLVIFIVPDLLHGNFRTARNVGVGDNEAYSVGAYRYGTVARNGIFCYGIYDFRTVLIFIEIFKDIIPVVAGVQNCT